jgi:hypothetical protein
MIVLGIAGYARCGKDTFVGIAKNILVKNGYASIRVAFADSLKKEIQEMLKLNGFDLNVYTENSEAKSKIRPLLVWWGCSRRDLSPGGTYWVERVDKDLRKMELGMECKHNDTAPPSDKIVALVSDVRFPNEADWVHKNWSGQIIHLRRYIKETVALGADSGGAIHAHYKNVYDAAPNEEEKRQDPLVLEKADYRMEWESRGKHTAETAIKDEYLQGEVLKALNATRFFNGKLLL